MKKIFGKRSTVVALARGLSARSVAFVSPGEARKKLADAMQASL
jgi:hypothetical protein